MGIPKSRLLYPYTDTASVLCGFLKWDMAYRHTLRADVQPGGRRKGATMCTPTGIAVAQHFALIIDNPVPAVSYLLPTPRTVHFQSRCVCRPHPCQHLPRAAAERFPRDLSARPRTSELHPPCSAYPCRLGPQEKPHDFQVALL